MTSTYQDRLRLERRLLAALFLWPSQCDLDAEHFVAPAHQALYEAIQAIPRAPISDAALAVTYDDEALAQIACRLLDGGLDDLFRSEGGFWTFARHLQQTGDTRAEIPALVDEVRQCHRCGR